MSKAEQSTIQVSLSLAKKLGALRGIAHALVTSEQPPFSDLGLALQIVAEGVERDVETLAE